MQTNMFEGTKVRLRGIAPEDWRHFLTWDLDSDAQRHGWQVWPPYGEEGAKEFAKQESLKKPADGNNRFIIETLAGAAVGSISTRVDARRLSFEYGISLGREHWGKGYAEEAVAMVCRYMFGELRLHKVNASVYAFNERSASMHRKFGMVLEGTIREGQFTDGRFWDIYQFGMTAPEYFAKYGEHWGDLG
jgi:RimJ/RimL family protein N-acetyltransferase